MVNNYDPLARYYDFLSRLVYGRTQVDAQIQMLDQVRPGDKLLIVGGGTGWILETLAALYPDGLQITYVEPSKVMIRLARRRKRGGHNVSFVELPIEQFFTEERFDCILTGFLFDNFNQEHTEATIRALDTVLVDGGHWLNADFYYTAKRGTWWQWLMLQSMYWVIGGIVRVEAHKLPNMEACFGAVGYAVVRRTFYFRGFIQGVVYRKR